MAYAVPISWVRSLRIDCTDLVIIVRQWLLMQYNMQDSVRLVKHQPPELLHPTVASWLFEAWGIDVIGLISPPSARGHQFILAISITSRNGRKLHRPLKLKLSMLLTSPNTMSSTDLCPQEDHLRQWSLICEPIILPVLWLVSNSEFAFNCVQPCL